MVAMTPRHELAIKKCWKPSCSFVAVLRDCYGYEWCHPCYMNSAICYDGVISIAERYDVAYYRKHVERIYTTEVKQS